eukprot:3462761-Pleurochrysis_carterae.AAC.1
MAFLVPLSHVSRICNTLLLHSLVVLDRQQIALAFSCCFMNLAGRVDGIRKRDARAHIGRSGQEGLSRGARDASLARGVEAHAQRGENAGALTKARYSCSSCGNTRCAARVRTRGHVPIRTHAAVTWDIGRSPAGLQHTASTFHIHARGYVLVLAPIGSLQLLACSASCDAQRSGTYH